MNVPVHIRMAVPEDAAQLLSIYAPYVEHTAVSFEYTVPSVEEFSSRIENTLKRFAWLVAERDGVILGYAYANTFKPRPAYAHCVESTIYLREDAKGQGIGKALYNKLMSICKQQNIINFCACIAVPNEDDPYLSNDSMLFHSHLGFRLVGTFEKCGRKFDRWYDMIWMEKLLQEHTDMIGDFIPLPKL